jgi:hypothetical protein
VKDQQMVGVCWAFAMSSVMENALRRRGSGDVVAPLHLVASDAWRALHKKGQTDGMVVEPSWPYDPAKACKLNKGDDVCGDAYHVTPGSWRDDPMLRGEVESANARGAIRATKMEVIEPGTFEAIADELATGREVWASIRIDHKSWSHPRGDVLEDYSGEERGPHAVTVVGYRTAGPRGRELLVKNSWGADWGQGGYVWLSERTLKDHGDQFLVLDVEGGGFVPLPPPGTPGFPFPFPGANGQPPPGMPNIPGFPWPGAQPGAQPGSQPAPQPQGACPQGQVNDVVTRACSAPCKNGFPPAAGACLP